MILWLLALLLIVTSLMAMIRHQSLPPPDRRSALRPPGPPGAASLGPGGGEADEAPRPTRGALLEKLKDDFARSRISLEEFERRLDELYDHDRPDDD